MARFRFVMTCSITRKEKNMGKKEFKTFQMKMYKDEDEKLSALAASAGVDKTNFAKQRIFSDEKILILDKANYIARSLIEINDHLGCIKDTNVTEILNDTKNQLASVYAQFKKISKEITDFKAQNQEENE